MHRNSKEGELCFHTSANTRTSANLCRGEARLAPKNVCQGIALFYIILYTRGANFGSLQCVFFGLLYTILKKRVSLTLQQGCGSFSCTDSRRMVEASSMPPLPCLAGLMQKSETHLSNKRCLRNTLLCGIIQTQR